MKRIFKYELNVVDGQTIALPKDSAILSVANQSDAIVLYAIVDENVKEHDTYDILIRGTGHCANEACSATFLGTVALYGAKLMYHVFYRSCHES